MMWYLFVFVSDECEFVMPRANKRIRYISHLSLATWNIQGTKSHSQNKLQDKSFRREVSSHHIIGLTETHCVAEDDIGISGFHAFQKCRPKTKNVAHGGIAVLVKNEIRPGVSWCDGGCEDIAWVVLKKKTVFGHGTRHLCRSNIFFTSKPILLTKTRLRSF